MVLVIGGMCQGKHDFCSREFPDAKVIEHYEDRIRKELEEGRDPVYEAEKWLESEEGDLEAGESENGKLVIIMNEVGSGVVPMEKEERLWREAVGRVSCLFAERAEHVYRLLAGIPQKLK